MIPSRNQSGDRSNKGLSRKPRCLHGIAVLAIAILFGSLADTAWAQSKKPSGDSSETKSAVAQEAQNQRRNWVKRQIPKLVSDERERAEILAQLNEMNDDQIQKLAIICLDELESRRKQQFDALREANARQREFESQTIARLKAQAELASQQPFAAPYPYWVGRDYFGRRSYWSPRGYWSPHGYWSSRGYWGPPAYLAPAVGYIPVITWLPDGVSLSAQSVVSPDGRYVRTSVVPFFSTVGPVHTFNFMTGETRRYDR